MFKRTQNITLEELEIELHAILERFRSLSATENCGYAGDHAGWNYFDLANHDEGTAPEICLFYNDFTFRIKKKSLDNKNYFEKDYVYSIVIDTYESETRILNTSSAKEAEDIITAVIETNIVPTSNITDEKHTHTQQTLEEGVMPTDFDNTIIAYIDWALQNILEEKQYIIETNVKTDEQVLYAIKLNNNDLLRLRRLTGSDINIELLMENETKIIKSSMDAAKILKDTKNILEQYNLSA